MGLRRAPLLAATSARVSLFFPLFMMVAAMGSVVGQPPHACDPSNPATRYYRFCNTKLPIEQRVDDIVRCMTLPEKISQLGHAAPGIPRLGIPAYQWWSESLHGVSNSGPGILFEGGVLRSATSFPQVILTAASFNPLLWYRIGQK